MKFNKLTHLTIVVVLAIIFIVVYLYYTIKDVKKIHSEVQKLTTNITDMNKSITNITSTIIPLLKSSQVQASNMSPQCAYVPETVNANEILDDESSVNSQELKTIMETIDEEHKVEPETIVNDIANLDDIKDVEEMMVEQDAVNIEVPKTLDITKILDDKETDLKDLSINDLKKVSYEQLRRYCKANKIVSVGTKDVLIYRIKGITG